MPLRKAIVIAVIAASLPALAACSNTIRGVGRDAAGAVDATQNAGRNVSNAASH